MMTPRVAELRFRRLEFELEIERAHAEYTMELSRVLWRGALPWDLRATRVAAARKVLRERVRKALDAFAPHTVEFDRPECETCHDHSVTCPDCAKWSEDRDELGKWSSDADSGKWPV